MNPNEAQAALKQLVLAAFVLRTVYRTTYDQLVADECTVFAAAASVRPKLFSNSSSAPHWDVVLIALVLLLDFDIGRQFHDKETFTQAFVDAEVGDASMADVTHRHCEGMRGTLFDVRPTVQRIDKLLAVDRPRHS